MRLFGRRKDLSPSGLQEAQAQRIAGRILLWHRKAADYMNQRTQGFSSVLWLWVLGWFCLGFGGYCLYLLVQVLV
jgi:hypothetical protein